MPNDKNKNLEEKDKSNDEAITKYGEFIPSYFAWISTEQQKEKADKLNDMTKNK